MGEVDHLTATEGIQKIKSLAENKTCFFCTYLDGFDIQTRPMINQGVDDNGDLWFFSKADSEKNNQINANSRVELLFADPGNNSYLIINGIASVQKDQKVIDELWTRFAKIWFREGKEDPTLTLIKVEPQDAHYWETQHGKIISSIKILVSAITGTSMDYGREGDIQL